MPVMFLSEHFPKLAQINRYLFQARFEIAYRNIILH